MPAPPLRIGLVGAGHLAREVHLPTLGARSDAEVVAVAEPDPERRSAALTLASTAVAFSDYRDLLAVDGLDAVVACLPTGLHAEVAVATFERGRPLYLEKPIAATLADGEAVLDAWQSAGTLGMIGFNYRFDPLYERLRQRLQEGGIGEPVLVRTTFSTTPGGQPEWKKARSTGGGVLLDLGAHHFDLIRHVLGEEVVSVTADVRSVWSEADTAVVELRMASGLPVQCFFSLAAVEEDRVEVIGRAGTLAVDRYGDTAVHEGGAEAGGRSALVRGLRTLRTAPYLLEKRGAPWGAPSYARALGAFVRGVRVGRMVRPSMLDGYRSLAVVVAAEASAASGRAESVSDALLSGAPLPPVPPPRMAPPAVVARSPLERPASLSILLLAPKGLSHLDTTLRHLRAQTVRNELELVLLLPSAHRDGFSPRSAEGFAGWQLLDFPVVSSTGTARFLAARAARAPIVVLAEDHCFPEPSWAEHLLAAHGEGVAAVGPTFENANPATATSWVDFFLNFGGYAGHTEQTDRGHIAWHNGAYRRDLLLEYGADLPALLEVESLLHRDLRERGLRLVQAAQARVHHQNFSRVGWMALQQFVNGRQFGAARSVGWSRLRRWGNAAGWPVAAARQYGRVMAEVRRAGQEREIGRRAVPLLALGLAVNAIGQATAYVFGAGRSGAQKFEMEFDRSRYMARQDRAAGPVDLCGSAKPALRVEAPSSASDAVVA